MFNSPVLDTLIACVVVILILSLIVQSIQAGIKKLLGLKSKQIEDSLVDLFQTILNEPATTEPTSFWGRLWWNLRTCIGSTHSSLNATPNVQALYNEVTNAFAQVGRVSSSGKLALDNLNKDDLLKILGKIGPHSLLPGLQAGVQTACNELRAIETEVKSVDRAVLSGEASAKFTALQSAITPLLNDFTAIAQGGTVQPKLLIQDIAALREIKLDTATTLLGDIQAHVAADLAAAQGATPPDPVAIKGLKGLVENLGTIATAIAKFQKAFDAAISLLRSMLRGVETWFDTVMQSFEERYARAMKTWALTISFILVVCLNANFFDLYSNVTTNSALRNTLVQSAPAILQKAQQDAAAAQKQGANAASATVQSVVSDTKDQIARYMNDYANFGFHPFLPAFADWWKHSFRPPTVIWGTWFQQRVHDVLHIIGWIVMALLLSVGAPFWENVLESILGIKKMLQPGSQPVAKDGSAGGNSKGQKPATA